MLVWIAWTFLHSYFPSHCSLLFLFLISDSSWQDLDRVLLFLIYYLETVIMIQPLLCVSSVCFSSVKIYLRKSNTLFVLFHIDKMPGINYDRWMFQDIDKECAEKLSNKKIWSGSVFVCFCEMLVPFVMCIYFRYFNEFYWCLNLPFPFSQCKQTVWIVWCSSICQK